MRNVQADAEPEHVDPDHLVQLVQHSYPPIRADSPSTPNRQVSPSILNLPDSQNEPQGVYLTCMVVTMTESERHIVLPYGHG